MIKQLRIATRESPLAMWQANWVADLCRQKFPDIKIELIAMTTKGDQILDRALSKVGGKGLFIKELEQALIEERADIAVHSLKDVPMQLSDEFSLCAMQERETPNDALVSNLYDDINKIPAGAIIGTSSLRRQAIIRKYFPHLQIKILRGNLGTRLRKLDEGEYQAIILACAGLLRMNFNNRIAQKLPLNQFIPAAGQGVVAIECLQKNHKIFSLMQELNNWQSWITCTAERSFAGVLQGGCEVPISAYGTINLQTRELILSAMVADPQGSMSIVGERKVIFSSLPNEINFGKLNTETASIAYNCGVDLAKEFISKGANEIVKCALAN